MKIRNHKLITGLLFSVALGAVAQAAPITGNIAIGSLSTVSLDKFTNTVTMNPGFPNTNAIVSYRDGTFTSLLPVPFTTGTYKDFIYSPLSVVTGNPIWTFGGVTFDLTQVTFIDEVGPGLVLLGTGVIKAAGYDDTVGAWSFTTVSTTNSAIFSWASTASASVPDGGTSVSLLGLSLLGLAGVAKKLRKK